MQLQDQVSTFVFRGETRSRFKGAVPGVYAHGSSEGADISGHTTPNAQTPRSGWSGSVVRSVVP